MAKQNKKSKSAQEAEETKSVGDMMDPRKSQRSRNLAVKAELVKSGERKPSEGGSYKTQREKNLALKQQLSEQREAEFIPGDAEGESEKG